VANMVIMMGAMFMQGMFVGIAIMMFVTRKEVDKAYRDIEDIFSDIEVLKIKTKGELE